MQARAPSSPYSASRAISSGLRIARRTSKRSSSCSRISSRSLPGVPCRRAGQSWRKMSGCGPRADYLAAMPADVRAVVVVDVPARWQVPLQLVPVAQRVVDVAVDQAGGDLGDGRSGFDGRFHQASATDGVASMADSIRPRQRRNRARPRPGTSRRHTAPANGRRRLAALRARARRSTVTRYARTRSCSGS